MVTGDYHGTAISVARDVGMLEKAMPVIVIDTTKSPSATQSAGRLSSKLLHPIMLLKGAHMGQVHSQRQAVPAQRQCLHPKQLFKTAFWVQLS